ncbi:CAP domain-containing protein [Streptomyces sp. NBC_00094]|uniref:CAP domain-containing protein n=1 Tax=Streptomyces sp. NBC_00094 TaxID=2903620 RepID=UPI002256AC6D|nr:CAP domain-containing protein [Streptomyces sp. NBC_00094]MCX5393439.1 CAP domain-containing protein [Streptomyces sp. NBC_00094]
MGRHRRSDAAPAAEDYAAGTDSRHRGDRRKRRITPVRTGLLGASAAVAVGAVAVASGLLPGGDTFTVGNAGTGERQVQSRQAPELTTQGGATQTPADGESGGTSGGTASRAGSGKGSGTTASPSAAPSSASAKPSPKPTPTPTKSASSARPVTPKASVAPSTKAPVPKPAPTTEAPVEKPTETSAAPSTADRAEAAEAEVLRLVNAERSQVGCTPVRADAQLAALAGAFSADMAARDFFDHTDPDGATPWARAEQAGVSGLGGENIARGQADAAAVMDSWMNSDGHRANILNCDFTTLGVGVQFGDGGPWWTQDFGR